MFKKLQKILTTASADNKEEATNMATKDGQTENSAINPAELQALLESATTTLAATQGKLAEMTALHEAVQAALQSSEDVKAALIAEATQKRLDSRKAVVVASVGTTKADALLAATDTLDDVSFNAVVSALSGSFEAEAKTDAFKEVGAAAPEEKSLFVPPVVGAETEEMKMLKAKYQSNTKGNK